MYGCTTRIVWGARLYLVILMIAVLTKTLAPKAPATTGAFYFFNQIAVNAEAVSDSWTFNGYGLIPVGDVEQKLNSHYHAGALNTYGLDVGYFITPALQASVGYYYQHRDQEDVDGSGVLGRLAYDITQGLTAGINVSYDEAFDTRVSADLKVRFGGPSTTANKKKWETPTINALTASPKNRDVRVHDCKYGQTVYNTYLGYDICY